MLWWSVATGVLVVLALMIVRRGRSRPQAAERPAPAGKAEVRPRRLMAPHPRTAAISEIDDPVTATATLIHAVAGPVGWPLVRESVLADLTAVASAERASDAIMFAEWAVRQGIDEHSAIDALAQTLCRYLGQNELALVIELLDAATAAGGPEAEPYADHAKSQLVATAS